MNALFLSIIYSAIVPQSIICGCADFLYYYYYFKVHFCGNAKWCQASHNFCLSPE